MSTIMLFDKITFPWLMWTLVALLLMLGIYKLVSSGKIKWKLGGPPPLPGSLPKTAGVITKWLWRVALLAVIIWWIHSCNSKTVQENERLRKREVELARALHEEKTQIKPEKVLVASWVSETGLPVEGTVASGPMDARVYEQTATSVWITVRYKQNGAQQTTWNFLSEDPDGMWRGTWEQEKPKRRGRLDMEKLGPDYWYGTMTDAVGNRLRYKIKPVNKS
jgi:hypothetical protein